MKSTTVPGPVADQRCVLVLVEHGLKERQQHRKVLAALLVRPLQYRVEHELSWHRAAREDSVGLGIEPEGGAVEFSGETQETLSAG